MKGQFEDLTGLRGGEMMRMRKGMSSVSVVLVMNMERKIGGRTFMKALATSSLEE